MIIILLQTVTSLSCKDLTDFIFRDGGSSSISLKKITDDIALAVAKTVEFLLIDFLVTFVTNKIKNKTKRNTAKDLKHCYKSFHPP